MEVWSGILWCWIIVITYRSTYVSYYMQLNMYVACAGMDTIQEKKDMQKNRILSYLNFLEELSLYSLEMEAGRKRKTHWRYIDGERQKGEAHWQSRTTDLIITNDVL